MFVVKIEGIISNRISVFNPHADIKCFFDGIVAKRLSPGMGFGVLILQTLDGYVSHGSDSPPDQNLGNNVE